MDTMPESRHVFLSYSRDDAYIMIRIRKELENMGISVWTDEGLIPGTESWKKDIEKAIRASLGIVVILSPSAYQSLWVERELDFARVHGIKIIPVLVHGEPSNAIPIDLITSQWIDLRRETDFSFEMKKLAQALEGKPGESFTPVEYPKPGKTPARQTKVKSSSILVIVAVAVIGVCIISATILAIIYGPELSALFKPPTPTMVQGLNLEPIKTTEAPTPPPTEIPPTEKLTLTATSIPPSVEPTKTKTPTSPPPTKVPSNTPTRTHTSIPPTSTRTPQIGFQANCIHSGFWTTHPTTSSSDDEGCLLASNMGFDTQNQSLTINVQNPMSDNRYGIYTPINGDVLIEFNLRIDQLETGADNELVSLGFGIISLNPVNTETDGFVFYVIESNKSGYPVFLKKGERGLPGSDAWEQYIQIGGDYYRYSLGANHRLSFQIEGNQLSIYINGDLIRSTNLNFGSRAFYIGYKFENIGGLSATVSDFGIAER